MGPINSVLRLEVQKLSNVRNSAFKLDPAKFHEAWTLPPHRRGVKKKINTI